MLRLPLDIHEKVVQRAKARGVSMNTLIVDMVTHGLASGRDYAFAILQAEMQQASRKAQEQEQAAKETREYLLQLGQEYQEMLAEMNADGVDTTKLTRASAARRLADDAGR